MKIRQSYDCLISTMRFPRLVKLHFYIESGPSAFRIPFWVLLGCQPVWNFRNLYGFYMQNTGVWIWHTKYGNWALSVLSLKVLLPEQSLPVWVAIQSSFVAFSALKPSNTSLITKTFNLLSSTCGSNRCSCQLLVPVVLKESTRVSTGTVFTKNFPGH